MPRKQPKDNELNLTLPCSICGARVDPDKAYMTNIFKESGVIDRLVICCPKCRPEIEKRATTIRAILIVKTLGDGRGVFPDKVVRERYDSLFPFDPVMANIGLLCWEVLANKILLGAEREEEREYEFICLCFARFKDMENYGLSAYGYSPPMLGGSNNTIN